MKIIIAPNAFKGTLSAILATKAIYEGLHSSGLNAELIQIPISDGGDGLTEILTSVMNGIIETVETVDPLGRKINAEFGWIEEKSTAIIELASASGMRLLHSKELNPMLTSTYGTGMIIKHALNKGAKELIIGLGGSATVDAGMGIIQALGGKLKKGDGQVINSNPNELKSLEEIDLSDLDERIFKTQITVVCDVTNPLMGDTGAAKVFAAQKGATPEMIQELETMMTKISEIVFRITGHDPSCIKHMGAAGGTPVALKFLLKGNTVPGAHYMAEKTGFSEHIKTADLVITAEGKLDVQTLSGKGPCEIARIAMEHNVKVIILPGSIDDAYIKEYEELFDGIFPIQNGPCTIEEAIDKTYINLSRISRSIGKVINMRHAE